MFPAKKQPFSAVKSAFTLIELMVVMGLIMIVMTLGIPRLVQHNETPLGGSISAVMDACASARSKAILSGKPMKMIVDASNYSVTVGAGATKPKVVSESSGQGPTVDQSPDEEPAEEPKPASSTGPAFSGKIHEDVGVTFLAVNFLPREDEGRAEVTFHPNGTSDEFTIGMIHVTGDNVQRFVQLDSVTGAAYIKTEDEIQDP